MGRRTARFEIRCFLPCNGIPLRCHTRSHAFILRVEIAFVIHALFICVFMVLLKLGAADDSIVKVNIWCLISPRWIWCLAHSPSLPPISHSLQEVN